MLTTRFLHRTLQVGLLAFATGAAAHSDDSKDVLYAANNGIDSATCGARSSPCRSINQTIANASAGALIIVGPGVYGDLNRDGDLTEENPDPACRCVFDINKRVTIISREGAQQTVLDVGPVQRDYAVRIDATGAVFGRELRGFTVIGRGLQPLGFAGIRIEFADRVTVMGNTVAVDDHTNGIWIVDGTGHLIAGNISAHNANGIAVNTGGNRIRGNYTYDNALRGIVVEGESNLIEFNTSTGNDVGIRLLGPGHVAVGNSVLGNRSAGFFLDISSISGVPHDVRLTRNNIYGNGVVPDVASSRLNCGLSIANASGPIDARHNYWGSAEGPGADPADEVCNSTRPAIAELVRPFAKTEFRIPNFW